MSNWQNSGSTVPEGEPGSGTTPEQPNVPAATEPGAIENAQVTPPEEPAVSAPNLPKAEQAEVAENDADSPVVTESEHDDVKLAAAAAESDSKARAENINRPVIRDGDPRVGGEHFN